MRRRQFLLALAATSIAGGACAQQFPSKPINWVVGFPPGGVANAAPDGHTIMSVEQGSMVFNTALYSKLPYDPKDLAPVCDLIRAPVILAVNPSFPAKDLKSFIDYVRSQPGKLNYGSPGRGLAHQLAMEAFKQRATLEIVDVQYKGIAPVVQDV